MLGFFKRNLQINNEETKSLAYKSMVRSNLEYCSSVWSPHNKNLEDRLKNLQKKAALYHQQIPLHQQCLLRDETYQLQKLGILKKHQQSHHDKQNYTQNSRHISQTIPHSTIKY